MPDDIATPRQSLAPPGGSSILRKGLWLGMVAGLFPLLWFGIAYGADRAVQALGQHVDESLAAFLVAFPPAMIVTWFIGRAGLRSAAGSRGRRLIWIGLSVALVLPTAFLVFTFASAAKEPALLVAVLIAGGLVWLGWRRQWYGNLILGCGWGLIAVLAGGVVHFMVSMQSHRAEVARIEAVIQQGKNSTPAGIDPEEWRQLAEAPRTGLLNFFVRANYCPTAKVRAMAVQFETRWPQGAKSITDVLDMISLEEATNPLCRDWGYFQNMRESAREIGPVHVPPANK